MKGLMILAILPFCTLAGAPSTSMNSEDAQRAAMEAQGGPYGGLMLPVAQGVPAPCVEGQAGPAGEIDRHAEDSVGRQYIKRDLVTSICENGKWKTKVKHLN